VTLLFGRPARRLVDAMSDYSPSRLSALAKVADYTAGLVDLLLGPCQGRPPRPSTDIPALSTSASESPLVTQRMDAPQPERYAYEVS